MDWLDPTQMKLVFAAEFVLYITVLGLAGVGYNALMLLGQKWIGKIKAPVFPGVV